MDLYKTHVISHTTLGTRGHLIRIPKLFDFEAGQVAGLGIKELETARIYSIAGSDFETYIDFLFDVKPGGALSPRLAGLKAGDDIYTTQPFGTFIGNEQPAWWIAAGTGIAPFKAMLDAGLHKNKLVIQGSREKENFYFGNEFRNVLGENYIQCCSGEKVTGMFHGRITAYLEQLPELPAGIQYYLCGSAEMVVDTRDVLIARGVPFERIVAEIYF